MPSVQIDPRFHGPPHSANGGYVCGRLAALASGPVAVSLHSPPPLGTPLQAEVATDGEVALYDGDTRLASATPAEPLALTVPTVTLDQATDARSRFVGVEDHPFPTCWVCGPQRPAGDGLRIFPGTVADASVDGLVAAPWTPDADVDDGTGQVAAEHVWSALDCPSYFGAVPGQPALLARLAADLVAPVRVGEPHVVLGWATHAAEGRKHHGASAILDAEGDVVASASALWLTLSSEALAALLAPA